MHLVYLPTRMNFIDRVLNGEFPEWYPFDGLGSSYVGNVVTSLFHPTVWLHLFLPHVTALSLSVLFMHFFAGMGTYRLLRFWNCGRLAGFLGAIAYAGSGYLLSMGGNLSYLEAAAAIPWAIWGFECSMRPAATSLDEGRFRHRLVPRSSWKGIALCAAAMALLALSGDPQALYITSIFLLACALFRPRREWPRALARLGLAGMAAVLAASPQLLPAVYASSVRNTGEAALSEARKFSLNPLRLLEFWSPGPWRTSTGDVPIELFSVQEANSLWSASVFLGAAVLSLASIAVAQSRMRREACLLAGLGTVALVVSLGAGTWAPGYELLQRVLPGWQFLRYPEKTVVFITLAAALLAGLGAQRLFEGLRARKWPALRMFQNRLLLFAAINIVLLLFIGSESISVPLLVMAGASPEAHAELMKG